VGVKGVLQTQSKAHLEK